MHVRQQDCLDHKMYFSSAEVRRVQEYAGKYTCTDKNTLNVNPDWIGVVFQPRLPSPARGRHPGPQHGPPPAGHRGGWEAGVLRGPAPAHAGHGRALRPRGVCSGTPGLHLRETLLGGGHALRSLPPPFPPSTLTVTGLKYT